MTTVLKTLQSFRLEMGKVPVRSESVMTSKTDSHSLQTTGQFMQSPWNADAVDRTA